MITEKNRWWLHGLFWAAFMYVFNTILWPLSQHEPLTAKRLLIGIPIWVFSGLIVGWVSAKLNAPKKTV
jgi:hypothetical protein